MNKFLRNTLASVMVLTAVVASAEATTHPAMLVTDDNIDNLNDQERAAAAWFRATYPEGVFITPDANLDINVQNVDCIWIHLDRLNMTPADIKALLPEATYKALAEFIAEGGNIYLSKHATLMLSKIGRIDAKFDPNIFGNGEGGKGTDVWALNAQIGYWQLNPDNKDEHRPEQYYDHRTHAIYADLEHGDTYNPPIDNFPMEGTGTGAEIWREDHNCCWDLNAYQFTADGANTVEKFEKETNSRVIGTWGHVQDYAVAGVVEFYAPKQPLSVRSRVGSAEGDGTQGAVIANGLACCEWAPRTGTNAFHNNLQKLTANTIFYLRSKLKSSGVTDITADAENDSAAAVVYYTMQGTEVNGNPAPGLYIRRCGSNVSKVIIR
ncbi:MAG: DUF4960 domain-containing protein [Bacteroidales bacterium]|nr:DUF4960 domain-containing protein [Bacteroidales bacterium]